MKPALAFLLSLLLIMALALNFRCDRGAYGNCDTFKSDTVLINTSVLNPGLQYHVNDTIWLTSNVSDTYVPLSGSPATIISTTDRLFSTIQPFSINTTTSLPTLQFANIEFNPVVREGLLQYSAYNGYNYEYKRQAPNNRLTAGVVAGRTGLYILEITTNNSFGAFNISNSQDHCVSYFGIASVPVNQQNTSFWNTLGVTSVSLPISYGAHTISQHMRNYLIVQIIP